MAGTEVAEPRTGTLVGNRLVLAGAVLYLLEWVAIVAAAPPGPFGPGTRTAELLDSYSQHSTGAAVAAAWFSVCLLGRVLVMTGLKASLRARTADLPLLDLAVAAMTVSVVMEVVAYAVVAGNARLAADGAATSVVVGLDAAAYWIDLLIFGPIGVSLLAAGAAVVRSRLFPVWLGWCAVLSGVAGVVGALVSAATAAGGVSPVGGAITGLAAVAAWVWMLATGVVLWRRS